MTIPPPRLRLRHRSYPCETTLSLQLPIILSLLLTPSTHNNPSLTFLQNDISSYMTQATTSFFPMHSQPFTQPPNSHFTPLDTFSPLKSLSNNPPNDHSLHHGSAYDIVPPHVPQHFHSASQYSLHSSGHLLFTTTPL